MDIGIHALHLALLRNALPSLAIVSMLKDGGQTSIDVPRAHDGLARHGSARLSRQADKVHVHEAAAMIGRTQVTIGTERLLRRAARMGGIVRSTGYDHTHWIRIVETFPTAILAAMPGRTLGAVIETGDRDADAVRIASASATGRTLLLTLEDLHVPYPSSGDHA